MIKFGTLKKIIIRGYEDYDTRLLRLEVVTHGGWAKPAGEYWYGIRTEQPCYLSKNKNRRRSLTYSHIPAGANVFLDDSCSIPATLVKTKYNVVTANTNTVPHYIVLGKDDDSDAFCYTYPLKVFVSDKQKRILLVYESGYVDFEHNPGLIPDLKDFQEQLDALIDDIDFTDFEAFSKDCNDLFSINYYSSEYYIGFKEGTLPSDRFVLEENLVTGTEECTAQLICSCYQLINSTDIELKKTALLTLANSDYSKCRDFLSFLLSSLYYEICDYRGTSTTVRWMFKTLDISRYVNSRKFVAPEAANIAKQFLTVMSQGAITFEGNVMHCTNGKYLQGIYGKIRKKLDNLQYDLETATLIANDK